MRPFRIQSKLARLKMVVAYARVMKTLREAAKPEDAPVTDVVSTKRKSKKR